MSYIVIEIDEVLDMAEQTEVFLDVHRHLFDVGVRPGAGAEDNELS